MKLSDFKTVKMNGKRLKKDMSLILKELSETQIVDIYARLR